MDEYQKLDWLLEQFICKRSAYFRGISTKDGVQPDAKSKLSEGVLYFTSHFGYALSKALMVEPDIFENFKSSESMFDITDYEIRKFIDPKLYYWIFPFRIDNCDIFDGFAPNDKRELCKLIYETDFCKKHPQLKERDAEFVYNRLGEFLAKSDWLHLGKPLDKTRLGIERKDLIELLVEKSDYDGFRNYDYNSYSSVGLFEKSLFKAFAGTPIVVQMVEKVINERKRIFLELKRRLV